MKKFTINSTLHEPEIFYVNNKGEGWLVDKNKKEFYNNCDSRFQAYKEYYLFINLYPTYA